MIICPKCGSADIEKGNISYPGCITDMERYSAIQDWDHDGYQCKVCKCKFTIWKRDDEFALEDADATKRTLKNCWNVNNKIGDLWKAKK